VYLTKNLAREAYESRSIILSQTWETRFYICITKDGGLLRLPENTSELDDVITRYPIWGLPGEYP
ncbi:MAG TPA: hypothetical protein O0Y05_03505, partial [Methanocorpusculum sp.]|nr:hypothetical protein [Methanocorpusculum sp.]